MEIVQVEARVRDTDSIFPETSDQEAGTSRSQLMDNSTLVIFALLCKNCKCEIPTEQKIGA